MIGQNQLLNYFKAGAQQMLNKTNNTQDGTLRFYK